MGQGAGMTGCKFFNAIAFSLAIASPTGAEALDLRVLSGSGVQPVMSEIIPRFESGSGHRVIFDYGTVGGMAARIQDGEFADVIIASEPQIAELEKHSKIVFGSRTDLAKTGIGIFVRKGTPKPDISSVDSFKRTMLASKSIGWNDPVAGAPVSIYMLGVFERLGISQEMKSKTVVFKKRSERFEAVARGDVEIGFNQISEIVAATGVDLVGPLPAAIQHYTLFSAGIVANSANKDAAQALLRFISAPDAKAVMKAKGFETP
jgi:molybdate transport system substrate-binding protein